MRRFLHIVNAARSFFVPRLDALRAKEELLHAIYSAAPVGIAIMDLHGRFVRTNPAFQALTGFTEVELRLKSNETLTHPDDYPRDFGMLQELLAGKRRCFTLVKRYRAKGGAVVWVRNAVSMPMGSHGEPRYIVALSEDITERRKAQEALLEGTERFRLLVASVTDYAIFMLDPEGRVASWNAGAERIYGCTAESIVGQHFSRLYPRADVDCGKPICDLETALAYGRFEHEGWRLRKDQSSFWANVVITPMRDEGGDLRGYAKVTRDLSERRQLELRLSESQARLRAFLDHSPAVIFMKDLDGRYIHVNARFQQCFGLTEQQIIGNTDDEIFTPAQALVFRANDGEVLARGAPFDFEETAQYVDGSRTSIVCKFPVFDGKQQIVGIGGIATDISERKRAERDLKEHAEQLRALSRRLVDVQEENQRALSRELHDCIGHKLTALNLNLDMVLERLPESVKEDIGPRLIDSKKLVRATVDNIIDVMADLRPPLLDDLGLMPALRSIADQFVRRTGIGLALRGPEQLDRLDWQVEISLCRIVQEALNNLTKHANATQVELEVAQPPDRLTLAVIDNGVGFDARAPAPRGKRSGWGTLTMRERAQAIGATLTIDSVPGRGTTVTVALERRP